MKIGVEYLFVIIAFIAIIALSSYGASIVVPYQKDDLFSKQFMYEAMETEDKSKENVSKENVSKEKTVNGNVSLASSIASIIQSNKDKMLVGSPVNGNVVVSPSPQTKESFEGMFHLSPYEINSHDASLDRLSNLPGGQGCDSGRAAGYSNSMGPLCMDESTLLLLRTRGGNQSGAPSQIGQ